MAPKYDYGSIKIEAIEIRNFAAVAQGGGDLATTNRAEYLDLTPIAVQFSIYEDMFSPCITAELILNDGLALPEILPIIGDEQVRIAFSTPGEKENIDMIFNVISIEERNRLKDRQQSYLLYLAPLESIIDHSVKLRNAYGYDPSEPIHEMVKKIYEEYIQIGNGKSKTIVSSPIVWKNKKIKPKKIEIEETEGDFYFCLTHKSPYEAIQFLAKEAKSKKYPDISNFIFYEDHEKYNFKTLESIKDEAKPVGEYFFGDPGTFNASRQQSKSEPSDYKRIIEFTFDGNFDLFQSMKNGMYDSESIWFDTIAHQFSGDVKNDKVLYNYFLSDFKKFKHIAKNTKKADRLNSDASVVQKTKAGIGANIPGRVDNKFVGDSRTSLMVSNHKAAELKSPPQSALMFGRNRPLLDVYKKASEAQLNTMKLTITIPGDSTLKPGDFLNIHIPSMSGTEDRLQKEDEILSGYWMAVSVRHMYNDVNGYLTVLETIKDVFEKPVAFITKENTQI